MQRQIDYVASLALVQPLSSPLPQPNGVTGDGDDSVEPYSRSDLKKLAETNILVSWWQVVVTLRPFYAAGLF